MRHHYSEDEVYSELDQAVYEDAYTFLDSSEKGKKYLAGVREALGKGATPSEIRSRMQSKLGIDREALALRCGQAAHFILQTEFAKPEPEPIEYTNTPGIGATTIRAGR